MKSKIQKAPSRNLQGVLQSFGDVLTISNFEFPKTGSFLSSSFKERPRALGNKRD
jgi:hypothetical protein